MLRTLVPVLLSCLPVLAAAQAPPKVGERLPQLELTGLANTSAQAFSDFYGRAVLLECFAYWCQPCVLSVPHLNELHREYEARGLSIVGVTSEGQKKTAPWVAKHGVEYAHGYDAKRTLETQFQLQKQGIPYAVLIDPTGVIVWTGHPAKLTKERIERALDGASSKPVWSWPAGARALAAPLQQGQYAAALAQAQQLGTLDGFDAAALVQERVDVQLARFEGLVKKGDYPEAFDLAERLSKDLAGLPEGEAIVARASALREDPAAQTALAMHKRFLELEKRATAVRSVEEGEKLRADLELFVGELSGKRLERRSQALLDSVVRSLENAKKREK